ncbi:MAG: TPM domain-containing protein [Clostridia bacterium]|nr:TPM domain-containing protein [Clostridia bacterium]
MTKRIISFLLVLILSVFCTMTVFAEDAVPLVLDEALLLDDAAEAELNTKLTALSAKYDFDFAVVTVKSVGGEYIGDYADACYHEAGYKTDGVLFLYSYEDNEGYILPVGTGHNSITELGQDLIFDKITAEMKEGAYSAAFTEFADISADLVQRALDGNPYNKLPFKAMKAVIIAVVIGFVFAFIVTGSMKGQLKSVKMQKAAANYQRPGSLSLVNSTDYFLYSTVSKVKKESNSSGGSTDSHGGSSRKF